MRMNWDAIVRALVLIRIGQELGSDTKAARAIHDAIELLAAVAGSFFGGR